MTRYTVVITKMMSQVVDVETDQGIKAAVAKALDEETMSPGAGDGYDSAGEAEIQCVDIDGVTVWDRDHSSEELIFE